MRIILLCLFAGTLAIHAQNANPAQQAEQFYLRGIAAEKAGDPATARAAYQRALALNPRHANAQFRIGELKASGGKISANARAAKFGQTMIPVFNLENAPVSEALDALRSAMDKASDGKDVPNFVIKDPAGVFKNSNIMFQLKGVPAKAILDYIAAQASAKITYEEYAVVIEPRSGS